MMGTALKRYDLGMIGNRLLGIIGGGIGAQLIGALMGGGGETSRIVGPDGFDFGTLVAQFAAGAFGGGAVVVITGPVKENMGRPRPA